MSWTKINSKMIEVPANSGVLARSGSMLAYKGEVVFAPTAGAGGVGGFVGRMVRGEQVSMMQVQGQGTVLLGHAGLNVEVLDDVNEQIIVEADRLLAYDNSKQAATRSISAASGGGGGGGGLRGALRGAVTGAVTGQGMWTTVLTGPGGVAVLSHGPIFELQVGGGEVKVDPQAFVCAIGNVKVDVSANVGFREMTGRGSGESIQLKCSGSGKVLVQASEQKL